MEDLLQNHYMFATLLESMEHYPEALRDVGNRMDFCQTLSSEFTETFKDTAWGEELLWEEELERYLHFKLGGLNG